jgi:hypothetical protein
VFLPGAAFQRRIPQVWRLPSFPATPPFGIFHGSKASTLFAHREARILVLRVSRPLQNLNIVLEEEAEQSAVI